MASTTALRPLRTLGGLCAKLSVHRPAGRVGNPARERLRIFFSHPLRPRALAVSLVRGSRSLIYQTIPDGLRRVVVRSSRAMTERTPPNVEVVDLAPGLWIWRIEHPSWRPDADWQEVVTCISVDAGGERWLI